MGISQETFEQVKNILRKLDRSIDSARSERLGTSEPEPGRPNGTGAAGEGTPGEPGRARRMERPDEHLGGANRPGVA